jgi:hypothetical protein
MARKLWEACEKGDVELAMRLLDEGCAVNSISEMVSDPVI